MSHKATNWAIEQRGLKPTAKVVLFHLADRHNPDNGCFPSQDRLAADCEISRASLNKQLALLEARGLLRRIQRRSETTKRQLSTRYVFPFEDGFKDTPPAPTRVADKSQDPAPQLGLELPCPDSGHGAVSSFDAKPCPENDESRVQNLDTNLVREPLREPCVSSTAFEKFWKDYPRPRNREKCLEQFNQAVAKGVTPDWIVRSAAMYAAQNAGNSQMYLAYADNWLEKERWTDFSASADLGDGGANEEKLALFWAGVINRSGRVPQTAFGPNLARLMLQRGLVTLDKLRGAGMAP